MTHFLSLEFHIGCNKVSPELSVTLKDSDNCICQYLHTQMRTYVHTEKRFYQAVPVIKPQKILVN